ncbi:MAG: aminoacyl-tRNA hydrolase [Clostridia bacterium]|nr:aminoacyl-tRNA hydrolase [Clostridia bacterium]
MKLIVGLGNPDAQYFNTYHNLGFKCADKVAAILGAEFKKEKFRAKLAETGSGDKKILIAKPLTYMNLSGESVKEIVAFYKLDLKDLLVIYDDYDLNKGFIRIRESGSAGTHNGMRNLIKELGSGDFPRVRIGFKPDEPSVIPLIDFVLSGIKEEDKPLFEDATTRAANAAAEFARGAEVLSLVQKYNGRK